MADFVDIPILESMERCGIKFAYSGKTEITINCPFCNDKKKRMRLNINKNQYYCHHCTEGGNAITLYAKLSGIDNKTAFYELIAGNITHPTVIHKKASDTIKRVPLPLAERHAVYSEFLLNLSLSAKHKENLLKRGLCDEIIIKNQYRTTPDYITANRIAEELAIRFSLTGVPGFYTKDKSWRMALYKGLFIPVRSIDGMIQGLQIRLDDTKKRKYRWFSGNQKENGTPANSWIHTVNSGGSDVFISEGALKADVAAHLTGDCFIGLSGANSVNGLVPLLKSIGVNKVYEALDMDKYTNKNVATAASNIHKKLAAECIHCIPCVWDCNFNGIDDYLMSMER